MPTPPVNRDSIISQRTDGTRRPYSIEAEAIFRISVRTRPPFSGENPTSCISLNATTNIATRMRPRRTKGIPRFVSWAISPPATEPVSIATPVTTWPRPKTDSSSPVKPVALSASTSHASTAPEKKVNPRPISMETTAHCQTAASIRQSSTYSRVDAASVTVPSRYDARRPTVSATTPVGTSKITMPAVKKALAANASRFESPASSRKMVLMPQIREAASVLPSRSTRYVRWTEPGVGIYILPPSVVEALENALVGGDLVQDLLAKGGLIPLANALEVAKRSVQAHPTMDYPGASLGKSHQVDLVAPAFGFPGQRPARRPRLVADASYAAELLAVDGLQLVRNQPIEGDEQLEKPLAIVVNAPLELEIRLGNGHPAHDTFSPGFPQIVDKSSLDTRCWGSQNRTG